MIDHVSVAVSDIRRSTAFYSAILQPLGYSAMVSDEARVGFGKKYPELWLNLRKPYPQMPLDSGAHICLRARSVEMVEAFHAAALQSGGSSFGAPGPREAAMTSYFGAFIQDPDGNKIEVMTVPQG